MKSSLNDFYKKHYNLKTFKYSISNKKILFLIYDEKYYYYLDKNKFIDCSKSDSILDIVRNMSKSFNLDVINYYPVCFCNKTLVLAFRVSNVENSSLNRVPIYSIPEKYKKIVKYHRENFEMLYLSKNVSNEIKMSLRYIRRYKFHENVIKKYILTEKKRRKKEFKDLVYNYLPNKKSIIDVSCGDSSDLFEVAHRRNFETIVGNDIGINYLKRNLQQGVIYTNDDIIYNSIKDNAYDVVYCKNTLHHMRSINNIKKMLNSIDKISKSEILIIEIINPKESGGLSKFLSKWLYSKFLKDLGDCFLNEKQFKKITKDTFKNYNITYNTFTNVLGKYMIAHIRKEK